MKTTTYYIEYLPPLLFPHFLLLSFCYIGWHPDPRASKITAVRSILPLDMNFSKTI